MQQVRWATGCRSGGPTAGTSKINCIFVSSINVVRAGAPVPTARITVCCGRACPSDRIHLTESASNAEPRYTFGSGTGEDGGHELAQQSART